MFLKRSPRRKGEKEHVYWQLVESYRTPKGSRHRVVAYLGELEAGERRGWARLAQKLDGKAAAQAQQLSLFVESGGDTAGVTAAVPERIEVELKGVHVAGSSDFGDVFLGLALWRMLELDKFFAREVPPGREEVGWDLMASVLAIARLTEPDSELHIEDTWYRRTALPDLLGVAVEQVNDTRLYRTLDIILPLKPELEKHLKERIGVLFSPNLELLLYDVTSTYFEGQAARNPQAQRGYSRDHRPDCKQVCIALVVTKEGFPLGYEVFPGNQHDSTTVESIVKAMEEKYGQMQRIWVFDRGMVSEDNLEFVRARNGRYLAGTPKAQLKVFEAALLKRDWQTVRAGVEVKLVPAPAGKETFVLCRSAARRDKERAMHARFEKRIEAGLEQLGKRLASAKNALTQSQIERQIGRLLGANSRAARGFHIEVKPDCTHPSGLKLCWYKDDKWLEWQRLSEGCYLLRTNLTDQSPAELWQTYIGLTEVEAVFRAEKSELNLRPIWHQLEQRVQAHILFSFLAYVLWKTLQTWMERSGLGRGVRTVMEEFARIKVNDVILPTSAGRDVRLRCVTRPDPAQRAIIDRLGIALPQRLGRPAWVENPVPGGQM